MSRHFLAAAAFLVVTLLAHESIAQEETANSVKEKFSKSEIEFFENKIQPIFAANCMECHGDDPDELRGGLALISRRSILNGGDSGAAVDLDHIDESCLLYTSPSPRDGLLSRMPSSA